MEHVVTADGTASNEERPWHPVTVTETSITPAVGSYPKAVTVRFTRTPESPLSKGFRLSQLRGQSFFDHLARRRVRRKHLARLALMEWWEWLEPCEPQPDPSDPSRTLVYRYRNCGNTDTRVRDLLTKYHALHRKRYHVLDVDCVTPAYLGLSETATKLANGLDKWTAVYISDGVLTQKVLTTLQRIFDIQRGAELLPEPSEHLQRVWKLIDELPDSDEDESDQTDEECEREEHCTHCPRHKRLQEAIRRGAEAMARMHADKVERDTVVGKSVDDADQKIPAPLSWCCTVKCISSKCKRCTTPNFALVADCTAAAIAEFESFLQSCAVVSPACDQRKPCTFKNLYKRYEEYTSARAGSASEALSQSEFHICGLHRFCSGQRSHTWCWYGVQLQPPSSE